MAETKTKKPSKSKSSLIGNQAKPVVLDSTTKLDIDTNKVLIDNIIEAGLQSKLDISAIDRFTSISNARDQVYQLIDTMCNDSAVSAIVRTYTDDVCEMADNGHIVWCESSDPNISKFVNYLLNIMNVDKQIGKWVYCLIKYGDVYLRLYRESDYHDVLFNRVDRTKQALNEDVNLSIHSTNDNYSYYIEMVPDPSTMFELTRHGQTFGYIETPNKPNNFDTTSYVGGTTGMMSGNSNGAYTFAYKTNDVNIYQADDFVHAALEDNISRFPETVELFYETLEDTKDLKRKTGSNTGTGSQSYTVRRGKSLLYDSYKVWREKALLESSVLLSRVTRSGIVRKVAVEVGDMPKEQVQQTLRRVKELFEQRSAYVEGGSMSEYTNPSPVENFIYYATHNGQGNITVESVGGDFDPKQLTDLDWWNNKFYSSYGIPKQYFGWCLGADTKIPLLDGSTKTIEELYKNKGQYIGKGILGCNQDGTLCPTKISNIMLTNPKATLMRIWLDNGEYVDVTPDHRMMLRDGTFIPAANLKENDSLMPYYQRIKDGRKYVLDNSTGKFVAQYHLVSAKKGEPAEVGYNIHHKDGIKINDDFDNLIKLSVEDHCREHNLDLAAAHKKANEKRHASGLDTNANVGSKFITNGIYYRKLKAGEELPDGFWFEGPKPSEETKQKMSAARKAVLDKHPEYKTLGGFAAGEASEEVIAKMKAGQATYWNSLTPEEQEARRELSRQNGRANVKTMNAAHLAKLDAERPGVVRKERTLRCPLCNSIFTKKLNGQEYADYLQVKTLHFCCPEHRKAIDAGGKLARSYQLYLASNCDETKYEQSRLNNESRPDTFLKYTTLQNHLDLLNAYIPEANHRVVKIEYLEGEHPVYDLTVEDDCHTFALASGIFVHNCEDGAGFNGGSSLSIISSVYAKGVKRIQNTILQAITDAINLILLNKGCKAYLNNFVLKMQAPITLEEQTFRSNFSDRVTAISNVNSLFSDVEDKARRLTILKSLVSSLHLGDEIVAEIQKEIEAAEEAAKKAEEEAAAEAKENNENNAESNDDLDLSTESGSEEDLDLTPMPDTELKAEENFKPASGTYTLNEEHLFEDDDDLPTPEEADSERDFTENN